MSGPLEHAAAPATPARRSGRALAGALRTRPFARVAAVLAVLLGALLAFQYGGLGLAQRLGVVAHRERFTALAFAHPHALPTRLSPGAVAHLAVRIENREGARRDYRWRLVASLAGSSATTLARGAEPVAAGGARTFVVTARMPATPGTVRLVLRLAAPAEALSLRVAVG